MLRTHLSKQFLLRSLLFIGGSLIGFFCLSYCNSLVRIRSVITIGTSKVESKIIESLFIKKNIITLQNKDIIYSINARYPSLTVNQIEKKYPNVIVIYLSSEKLFAYVQTDKGYIAVSQKGIVLRKERSETVPSPAISFYQPIRHTEYQVGQNMSYSQLQKSLIFIQTLLDEGYQVETVAIDSIDMIACKTRGFIVAFSQERDTELQKYELRQLVKQIKIGALRVKRLDLRFDKPVVELQTP